MKALLDALIRLAVWLFAPRYTGTLHAAHCGPAIPDSEPEPQHIRVVEVAREPPPPPQRIPPPIEIDADGWMHGENVYLVPSERVNRLVTLDGNIDGWVWHWTDTRRVGAVALAKRTVKIAPNVGSCSVWLDEDGAIAQSAPLSLGAWHAGFGFTFKRSDGGVLQIAPGYNANCWFGGVEIENVGELRLVAGKWLGWPFAFGTKYGAPAVVPADEVVVHPKRSDRGWHRYTPEQIEGAERIVRASRGDCALLRENCAWGHLQIDPQNRTDPGPLWMGSTGDGFTVPKVGVGSDGILHAVLERVFGA